jgi:hypothetical protein
MPQRGAVSTAAIPRPSRGRVELGSRSQAARGAVDARSTAVALSPQHPLRRSSGSWSVSTSPHMLVIHNTNTVTPNSRVALSSLNTT